MGRSESKKTNQQALAQSAQDQANAQAALAATNANLSKYSRGLDDFMRFGRNTYGANGEYMRDLNTIATGAAKAGADKVGGALATNAMRTGANTANYGATLEDTQRQASEDLTQTLASGDADRLSKLTAINQYGVQASALPAELQATLYGHGTSGSIGQIDAAANAAKTPGFWDEFAPAVAGAAGSVGAGFTPHG